MIKGALFTISILACLVCVAIGTIVALGNSMSDNPSDNANGDFLKWYAAAVVALAVFVGCFFIK